MTAAIFAAREGAQVVLLEHKDRVGALIPLAITYFLYRQAVVYMMERFDILSNLIEFIPIQTIFPSMVAVAMALGVGIGFVGSFFTIRRHLKV